jgi:hypothetical protein
LKKIRKNRVFGRKDCEFMRKRKEAYATFMKKEGRKEGLRHL